MDWFVTSWWNKISSVLTIVPSSIGQRPAWLFLRPRYFSWLSSPSISFAHALDLKWRMAS